jgi:hypothetical protein
MMYVRWSLFLSLSSFTTSTLTMETENITEKSVFNSTLTLPIARENFSTAFTRLNRGT